MEKIFGRKNCNYYTDWCVRLNLMNDSHLIIAEQLKRYEAEEIYEQVKQLLMDKEKFIEIQTQGDRTSIKNLEFFQKRNVVSVDIKRD